MASSFRPPRALSAVPNHPPPSTPSAPLSQDFRADSVRVISVWKRSNVFDVQQRNANIKNLREATRRYKNGPHPPLSRRASRTFPVLCDLHARVKEVACEVNVKFVTIRYIRQIKTQYRAPFNPASARLPFSFRRSSETVFRARDESREGWFDGTQRSRIKS